jgi:4-hydroxybenzoate polyprenyltransferase
MAFAFAAFHFFLYTGITAYNSAYDRDEGPVGGMLQPPPVPPYLLEFSLIIQTVGAILALAINPAFFVIYLVIAILGVCYSHPRLRWKADPLWSALTVFVGQGIGGFLAGWTAAMGDFSQVETPRALLGMLSAALTTLGLYPLTQVYQIEEDSRRGDRTLAVVLGEVRALWFGWFCLLGAGISAVAVMFLTESRRDTVVVALAYVGILAFVAKFARDTLTRRHNVVSMFRLVMTLNFLTAGGFLIFIGGHLLKLL